MNNQTEVLVCSVSCAIRDDIAGRVVRLSGFAGTAATSCWNGSDGTALSLSGAVGDSSVPLLPQVNLDKVPRRRRRSYMLGRFKSMEM